MGGQTQEPGTNYTAKLMLIDKRHNLFSDISYHTHHRPLLIDEGPDISVTVYF